MYQNSWSNRGLARYFPTERRAVTSPVNGAPMNGDTTPQELPSLSEFMRARRQEILDQWAQAVRAFAVAEEISEPRLMDHLPDLLDELADFVCADSGASNMRGLPKIHALERLDVGFDLKQVAHEYAILRDCVLRLYERAHGATAMLEEVRRFNGALDHAVGDAVHFYAKQRERVLTALDRVGSSTIGSLPMQELLDRRRQAAHARHTRSRR
jgi:hypothetical protein